MKKKLISPPFVLALAGGEDLYHTSDRIADDETLGRISVNIEVTGLETSFRIQGHLVERAVAEGETLENCDHSLKVDPAQCGRPLA